MKYQGTLKNDKGEVVATTPWFSDTTMNKARYNAAHQFLSSSPLIKGIFKSAYNLYHSEGFLFIKAEKDGRRNYKRYPVE